MKHPWLNGILPQVVEDDDFELSREDHTAILRTMHQVDIWKWSAGIQELFSFYTERTAQ
jgi:hypothetical protein